MKIWLVIIASAIVGVALGIVVGFLEARTSAGLQALPVSAILKSASESAKGRQDSPPRPKVAVDEPVYDFGTMDAQSTGTHEFAVRNVGTAPLRLSKGESTCKCTVSVVGRSEVSPGESSTVRIEWTPAGYLGPYEQTAKIKTNDPSRPELTLTIKGRITTAVQASPSELVFPQIAVGQTAQGQVHLYAFESDSMRAMGYELKDPSTAAFFDVTFAPIPVAQLSGEAGAKSGCLMRVHVKSGLPRGAFHQTIVVKTNLASTPAVEVRVAGKVGSDISVFGREWDEATGTVNLGVLDDRKDTNQTLLLVARGRYRDKITFSVAEVYPPKILQVDLGKKTPINDGVASQTPLRIHIPKGTGPANHLGSKQGEIGRIVLDTHDPQMPKLTILVSFAIEG